MACFLIFTIFSLTAVNTVHISVHLYSIGMANRVKLKKAIWRIWNEINTFSYTLFGCLISSHGWLLLARQGFDGFIMWSASSDCLSASKLKIKSQRWTCIFAQTEGRRYAQDRFNIWISNSKIPKVTGRYKVWKGKKGFVLCRYDSYGDPLNSVAPPAGQSLNCDSTCKTSC